MSRASGLGSEADRPSPGLFTHPYTPACPGHRSQRARVVTKATKQLVHKRLPAFPQREGGVSGRGHQGLAVVAGGKDVLVRAEQGWGAASVPSWRWHCPGAAELAVGTMPAPGPWGPRGGGQEQLISSRRSAVRGPQTHKPFIGVSGGETRMWTFIYFGFHFSLLFIICISSSVTRFFFF